MPTDYESELMDKARAKIEHGQRIIINGLIDEILEDDQLENAEKLQLVQAMHMITLDVVLENGMESTRKIMEEVVDEHTFREKTVKVVVRILQDNLRIIGVGMAGIKVAAPD